MTVIHQPEGQEHPDPTIHCPCRPTLSYPAGLELHVTHNPVSSTDELIPEPEQSYPVPGNSYARRRY